jgi:hypothetical protein
MEKVSDERSTPKKIKMAAMDIFSNWWVHQGSFSDE